VAVAVGQIEVTLLLQELVVLVEEVLVDKL
jgi:hypothetical protein